jgi:hypothetical protein
MRAVPVGTTIALDLHMKKLVMLLAGVGAISAAVGVLMLRRKARAQIDDPFGFADDVWPEDYLEAEIIVGPVELVTAAAELDHSR